jgi:hypothetical protein
LPNRNPAAPGAWSAALVDSLNELGHADQTGRDAVAQAVAAHDTASMLRMLRADSARSLWLSRIVQERGWPSRASAGDSSVRAAWLILQHSPLHEWQRSVLPALERLARRGELSRPELALFTDRVLVQSGGSQRYGSQFIVRDGRLEPSRIEDLSRLDGRRAEAGLPPIAEYVRMLGAMYKLPVVWPPAP